MHSPGSSLSNGLGNGFSASDSLGRRIVDRWEARPLIDSVLHLIWRRHQISRAEIAREIGLSRSTVTEVIKELLQTGFVKEIGIGVSSGGRRPIVLEFQTDTRIILGVDIGATHVSAVIIDLGGQILAFEKRSHSVRTDPLGTRDLVFQICDACLNAVPQGHRRLLSIGVALPSPVDPDHPEWLSEIIIPAWQGRSEMELLHKHYKVPVYIDNDANLGALAEHRWGAGQGVADLTYVKIAYGVGGGFILNGEIYRGAAGIAGEVAHIPINTEGAECVCGLKGCLATLVGGLALETRIKDLAEDYPLSPLSHLTSPYHSIETAASAGDPLALRIYQEASEYLSLAIIGWINMMNPSRVILGGGLPVLIRMLLEPVRKKIQDCSLMRGITTTEIRIGELGPRAESLGAATLALEEVFAEPGFYRSEH